MANVQQIKKTIRVTNVLQTNQVRIAKPVRKIQVNKPTVYVQNEKREIRVRPIRGMVIHQGSIVQIDHIENSIIAGEIVSALKVLRNDISNKAFIANSADANIANRILGIAKFAAAENESVTYISSGKMEDSSWNWDLTKPIWFDATGSLTQTPPSAGFVQSVAIPITDKIINVQIKSAIKLI